MGRWERADDDAILPVVLGTIAWAVALAVLVVIQLTAGLDDHGWWIGAALIGVTSGVIGLWFLTWRRGRRARSAGSGVAEVQ